MRNDYRITMPIPSLCAHLSRRSPCHRASRSTTRHSGEVGCAGYAPRLRYGLCTVLLLSLLLSWPGKAQAQGASYVIQGISGALRDNALALLGAYPLACNAPRWQADALRPRAERATRDALNALGYYHPKVTSTLSREKACWQLRIDVQAGPPVHVTALDIRVTGPGAQDPGFRQRIDAAGLHTGMVLDQGRYTALKRRLANYARNYGYFDAQFTAHRIRLDPKTNTASITLVMASGTRYAFGQTRMNEDAIRADLLHGFLDYRVGEPYDAEAAVISQNDLVSAGYFDTVRLQTLVKQRANGQVPMALELTPAQRYQLLTGIGYSTDTGPALRLDFRNRRVNRAGHRYSLNTQVARVQSQVGFKYDIPMSRPRTDWLTLDAGYQYQNTVTAKTGTWKVGVARTHQLGNQWLQRLSVDYLRETSTVANTTLSSQFLIPGIGYSRTVADSPLYPRRGWSFSAQLRGALQGAIANTSFTQATLNVRDIRPLLGGRLLSHINLGATAVNNVQNLAASLRFFTGGARSVRGYTYQSLGPVDAQGNVIGGKYLVVGSVEYDHRLAGNFDWAVFYDAGNAFNTLPFTARRGTGLGLRWRSPLGPIRLDFAHALNPLTHQTYLRIQISMGPDL